MGKAAPAPAPALRASRGLPDAQPSFSHITQFFHSCFKLLMGAGHAQGRKQLAQHSVAERSTDPSWETGGTAWCSLLVIIKHPQILVASQLGGRLGLKVGRQAATCPWGSRSHRVWGSIDPRALLEGVAMMSADWQTC